MSLAFIPILRVDIPNKSGYLLKTLFHIQSSPFLRLRVLRLQDSRRPVSRRIRGRVFVFLRKSQKVEIYCLYYYKTWHFLFNSVLRHGLPRGRLDSLHDDVVASHAKVVDAAGEAEAAEEAERLEGRDGVAALQVRGYLLALCLGCHGFI